MEFLLEQLANWQFYLIGAYPKGALTGLVLNIVLAVLSIVIGLFFGIIFGLGRISCRRYIRHSCGLCVDVVRSTPLLMIIFWFYFFLPVVGARLPPFLVCCDLTFGLRRRISGRDRKGRCAGCADGSNGGLFVNRHVPPSGAYQCNTAAGI